MTSVINHRIQGLTLCDHEGHNNSNILPLKKMTMWILETFMDSISCHIKLFRSFHTYLAKLPIWINEVTYHFIKYNSSHTTHNWMRKQ